MRRAARPGAGEAGDWRRRSSRTAASSSSSGPARARSSSWGSCRTRRWARSTTASSGRHAAGRAQQPERLETMVKSRGKSKHPHAPRTAASASPRRWKRRACAGSSPCAAGTSRRSWWRPSARGIRIVDTRNEVTAVFAADAAARLTGTPGRGRGHRGPRHHQHHHRAQERAARAVAGAAAGRRGAHRAAGPRRAAGHRPAAAGRAAREAREAGEARGGPGAGGRGGARRGARRRARAGLRRVPGRPPLRREADPRLVRGRGGEGHLDPRPAAALVPEPACRKMFEGSASVLAECAQGDAAGGRRYALALAVDALAGRAAAHGAGQPDAGRCGECRGSRGGGRKARRAGLSLGHGARPARARSPAADAPRAPQGAARGRLRAARGRALRLPPRLRQARAPLSDPHRRQPQRPGRAAEPHGRHRGHRRRRPLPRVARAEGARAPAPGVDRDAVAGATPSGRRRSTRRPRPPAST